MKKKKQSQSDPIKAGKKVLFPEKLPWVGALIVAGITFLIYLPALNNGFVDWDDGAYVYENNAIRSLDFGFFKWVFTSEIAGLWHPFTMFSFALNYAIGGLEPWGYHFTNSLFHASNALLVFILTFKLVKQSNPRDDLSKNALITGAVTAILFGIHPIHVESVAWISERKDVLSAFFYLLSLLAYLSYTSAISSRKHLYYWVCLAFFVLALMSKPMAVSLPIVLLILDFYLLGRLTASIKNMLIEKLPFFLLSLFASSATIWAHLLAKGLSSLDQIPFLYRLFIAARAYMFYIVKIILPLDLSPLYPLPSKIELFSMEYSGSLILWLIITLLSVWSYKRSKVFLLVWSYYVVTLIPTIGIIQAGQQAAADRYTYLPSIGLFLLAGLGVAQLCQRLTKKQGLIMLAVFVSVSGILAKMTVQQIAIWRNPITLWTHEIRIFPDSAPIAYSNRGGTYFTMGDYQSALRDYNKAIELNPRYANAYYNRGTVYNSLDYYPQAIEDFSKAIELNPKDAQYYNNRGSAYNSLGKYREAIKDYNTAIELNPQDAYAYYNRGVAYSQLGYHEQAFKNYKRAADLGLKEAQDMLSDKSLQAID